MVFFVRVYRSCRKRAVLLVSASLALVLVSALAATRFVVRDDATSLLPTRPPHLVEQFAILREAPLLQGLTITVSGPDPGVAADALAAALRGPDVPQVFSGSGRDFSPKMIADLCRFSPGLMSPDQLAALPATVAEDAMREALARDMRILLSPRGLGLRDLLAVDPFGICAATLKNLTPVGGTAGPRLEDGHLVSADGKHALILAEPAASVGDSQAAARVMARIRKAAASLPADTEVLAIGGQRYTEENAAVIQSDLTRVLPVSLAFLVVFFLVFVRSRRGTALFVLPTASLAVAAACAGVLHGGLSGIVLGFGSVVLGITADYAIHVYYAVRTGGTVENSLERVSRPLLLGAATTLAAFAAFFASSIPCIVQMTLFAICGIFAALFLALVVLPHCLRPEAPGNALPAGGTAENRLFPQSFPRPLALVWAALAVTLPVLVYTAPVNGDARVLSYVSDAMARDEARTREIWGGLRDKAMFAVSGENLDLALAKNDRLWADLGELPPESGFDRASVTSLAPILPSPVTQAARHADWKGFWRENGQKTVTSLSRLAKEAGFTPDAFDPFAAWIATEPETVTPGTLSGLGLPLPLLFARETKTASYVYSLMPSDIPPQAFLDTLDRNGATYVSGQTFRDALDQATREDMRRFGVLSLAAILAMTAFVLRSPSRMGIALLPVAVGLVAVLGVFRLFGQSLNIFHAMALPLVMALSVDYGVFMLARMEGVLDAESRKGVLLSGLTTLSGFGSLLLARHPALFSLGLTVTLGLAASLATALVLLPWLARGRRPEGVAHG